MTMNNLWAKLRAANDQELLQAIQLFGGRITYLCPDGDDQNNGDSDSPVRTLEEAYDRLRDGKNDTIVILADKDGLSDAAASCTIRVDAAFSWSKSATHLLGAVPLIAPMLYSPRARLAPTSTTTAFANFFTVAAGVTGCLFRGIQWFHDFGTDTTDQIAVTVLGPRNVFQNCHIAGGAKGDDTGGASLLLSSSTGNKGENYFERCVIGVDTIDRSVAASVIKLAGSQVPRNWFKDCVIMSTGSAATALQLSAAAQAIDRFIYFERCKFLNYGTTITNLSSINASQNGKVIYDNCTIVGATNYGDTTNSRTVGPAVGNANGKATAPSA